MAQGDPQFIQARLEVHRADLLALNVAYISWIFAQVENAWGIRGADIVGLEAAEYVASVIDKICVQVPPEGIFYLLERGGRRVAMGGLRRLSASTAEIKRIYVCPDERGRGLGETILARLTDDAGRFGYRRLCLETGPFMKSAHRIYEAAGFRDCPPYPEAEVPLVLHPHWRFMERPLTLDAVGAS